MLNHQCQENIYDLVSPANHWKQILNESITDISALADYIGIDTEKLSTYLNFDPLAAKNYALLAPKTYTNRIIKGDLQDPLLAQILPTSEELITKEGFNEDPVGDNGALKSDWLLQKYHGRALILTTKNCSINCRFCFRKNLLSNTSAPNLNDFYKILEKIKSDTDIEEIILSGGEPLLLDDNQLENIVNKIEHIDHIKRIRFHTRMAITIPQRLSSKFAQILKQTSKQIILIIHCNHPNEIDSNFADHIQSLDSPNITLLNQSVLLKGINDQADILSELNKKLFTTGILPYYLHLLDKVRGAHHFQVSDTEAKKIWKQLQGMLPGYLVPRLVREIAGKPAKTVIC